MINFKKSVFNSPVTEVDNDFEIEDFLNESPSDLMESMCFLEDAYADIQKNYAYAMYYGVLENSEEILMEGLSDLAKGAVEFFKKLIKAFTDFMKKILLKISAYLGDFSKFIEKHKEYLLQLNGEFSILGYEFTIDSRVPNTRVIDDFLQAFNRQIGSIDKYTEAQLNEEKYAFASDDYMYKVRAEIINSSNKNITGDKFREECIKLFRNGKKEHHSIRIKSAQISEIVNGYSDLKKSYTEAKKLNLETSIFLTSLKNHFERGAELVRKAEQTSVRMDELERNGKRLNHGEEVTASTASLHLINSFYSFKLYQAKILSNTVLIATTEKVNALKDNLRQNRDIIRRAISVGNNKKEGGGE